MSLRGILRALGAAIAALVGATIAWILIKVGREVTGGIHALDIDPRSGSGGLYVMLVGVVGALSGGLAARLGGSAARLAVIVLTLAYVLLGVLTVVASGRELDAILILVVMPPSSLLGGELWRQWQAGRRAGA